MSETAPETPDTGLDQRVSSLETGQQSILEKLDQLLGGGPKAPEPEPERPEVNIADEIRKQLDERDRRKPKAEPAPKAAPEPEQAPQPMARRVEKIMGWAD